MVQKGLSDMISGVWRIKWWKYRYVLFAAFVVNAFLINHFFFDHPLSTLNPFQSSQTDVDGEQGGRPPVPPPPPGPPKPPHGQSSPATNPTEDGSGDETIVPVPVPGSSAETETPPDKIKPAKPSPTASALAKGPPSSSSTFNLDDYNFNGEYVGWPLARVCREAEATQTENLYFNCDNNSGGIGNIRNFILTCIRYAIDAGASGIIMPRIQRRAENDLANIFTAEIKPFDYFFDEKHFRAAFGEYCPQLKIYNKPEDVPNAKQLVNAVLYPKDLNDGTDGCDGRGVNRHLDMFRTYFDRWMEHQGTIPNSNAPLAIRLKWATFFEWPIYRDGPEFAATFGDLLRIRPDIEALAALLLSKMMEYIGKQPDATGGKLVAPFLGVHLRTESDALNFWPDFNVQSEGYLKQGELRGLKHAYLASGNATDGHRFGAEAFEKLGMNVTSKTDLLVGKDLKRLKDLTWDQQALVDFLVLTKSSHFTGCSFSSFTMNIAFKRHLMTGGLYTRQWQSPGDDYTTLVGRFDSWFGDWMFMYECMWP